MTDVKSVQHGRAAPRRVTLDLSVPSTPANSFITDIAFWFVQGRGDWLASSAWVSLLGTLGISSPNARTALHRMTAGGYLERRRVDGRPGYAISADWSEWITRGMFEEEPPSDLAPEWTLLAFSIPESRRAERHAIRQLLGRLGFGSLGNGVWIASAQRQPDVREALQAAGLEGYVDLFQAEYTGFIDVADFARRCWDIDSLAATYRSFIADVRDRLKHRPGVNAQTFVDVVVTNNAWRRIEFTNPALPRSALPRDWPREDARHLRNKLIGRFLEPAREFVAAVGSVTVS